LKHRLDVLADTWWYGNSGRCREEELEALARLRAEQGFDAAQIVVGIPPEVGPLHPQAASEVGPAWTLSGYPNTSYLSLARDRVSLLLECGLRPIVYGGWGQHVDWIGVEGMKRWWGALASTFSGLDVVYCLCGEADLHSNMPRVLLPDRSSDDIAPPSLLRRVVRRASRIGPLANPSRKAHQRRIEAWREVLQHARACVDEPLLVHTSGAATAFELFGDDPNLLANTTQTGHTWEARRLLYERPLEHAEHFGGRPFMNLEPWYEGIRDSFGTTDQLFAFWASKLAGSTGHVYGAHGIWNWGDGRFLAHWGTQTSEEAMRLETPVTLGRLHRWFRAHDVGDLPTYVRRDAKSRVMSVGRGDETRFVELSLRQVPDRDSSSRFLDLFGRVTHRPSPPCVLLRGLPEPHEGSDQE